MSEMKIDPDEENVSKLGRRTIQDNWLTANRDAFLNMLCAWWPHLGWELITAKTREDLRHALQPVKDHPNRHYIDRLLRATNVTATAPEIRKKRLALGRAVKAMRDAQSKHDNCANECRELELAVSQATSDQLGVIQRELSKRRAELKEAQHQLMMANAVEKTTEDELLDKEAGYAQDQLLVFIKKAKYALNPLNLANAMAGLPYAIDVPFLGAWQSHARCSKLGSPALPSFHYHVFEAIESIWERSKNSPSSLLDYFQQEIRALPKTISFTHPTMGPQRIDNYARTHLCENWWFLQRAIEKSLQLQDDSRPIHFIIACNLDKLVSASRTHADSAVAKAARLQ